eukprot:TRINITY_DN10367_c0_g1_i4.p1 TRINITY_DN10367_c0_g1~~TRINITY_DN10367_c0_g1_i4.p1  ORF type:complete len:464 (+),score=51.85 TRINITY_DN10367_c0_g1_i4:1-1392(+)
MRSALFVVSLAAVAQGNFTVFDQWNSIPSGPNSACDSLEACEQSCASQDGCLQFSFNEKYKVCFLSNSSRLGGESSDHIVSGCNPNRVINCPSHTPAPPPPSTIGSIKWSVPYAPDTGKPYCGFKFNASISRRNMEVYHAVPAIGTYNHAAMINSVNGTLFLTWKNSPKDEDQPAALFAGPTIVLDGRYYASASPHQFCLFPYPYSYDANVLLLRRIVTLHPPTFGPIFWANTDVPSGFEEASVRLGLLTAAQISQADPLTAMDLDALNDWSHLPCATDDNTTTKCEACLNGCDVNPPGFPSLLKIGGSQEETHYKLPDGQAEIILQRTRQHQFTFSYRHGPAYRWSKPRNTTIPDADSNLNAGRLFDGRTYLLSNPCPKGIRDPLVVSLSSDGRHFDQAAIIMSCHNLSSTSTCVPRHKGAAKNPGPSYPQGVAILRGEAGSTLYVVATNNKEDVWVTAVDL